MKKDRDLALKRYAICKEPIIPNYKIPNQIIINFENESIDYIEDMVALFVETMMKKIPSNNLNLFYNNIRTTTFESSELLTKKRFQSFNKIGTYSSKLNKIKLNPKFLNSPKMFRVVMHELMHLSSTYHDRENENSFSGFYKIINVNGLTYYIGRSINEGYTQFLTERYFLNGKDIENVYPYQKKIVKILEVIIGKEEMQNFYFNANLNGLVESLKQYESEDNIVKFITDMDFLHRRIRKKSILPSMKNRVLNSFKDVNKFLLSCYSHKLENEIKNYGLDTKAMKQKIVYFSEMIPEECEVVDTKYKFENDEEMIIIVGNILGDYLNIEETNRKTI